MSKVINIQPVEKRVGVANTGDVLDVHSIFPTIQGEGPFTGYPAIFIRLAGCNLQCPMCDTEYTEGRSTHTVHEIVTVVKGHYDTHRQASSERAKNNALVVITGGEPFRQNIAKLANTLILNGYMVQVETNGTLPVSHRMHDDVTIVCSPKTSSVHSTILARCKVFKYVLSHLSVDPVDGLPVQALDHPVHRRVFRNVPSDAQILVQPMDSKDPEENRLNRLACIGAASYYGYVVQLQTHKYLGVE